MKINGVFPSLFTTKWDERAQKEITEKQSWSLFSPFVKGCKYSFTYLFLNDVISNTPLINRPDEPAFSGIINGEKHLTFFFNVAHKACDIQVCMLHYGGDTRGSLLQVSSSLQFREEPIRLTFKFVMSIFR